MRIAAEVVIRRGTTSHLGSVFGSAAVTEARTNRTLSRIDNGLWMAYPPHWTGDELKNSLKPDDAASRG